MSPTPSPRLRPLGQVSRLVVKVGTSSLVDGAGRVSTAKQAKVVREVASAASEGIQCVLVSSGAIASGFSSLGFERRPRTVARQQAAAGVGQGRLMAEYLRLFGVTGWWRLRCC
jgi:glutamate 5-kinase